MSVWREEDHPRGEDGRFIEKINAFVRGGIELPLNQDGSLNVIGLFKIPLDFFANKGIAKQNAAQLRKSIRSYKKRIKEHQGKIAHPERIWGAKWFSFDEERRKTEIKNWEDEISDFMHNIEECKENLRKKGEAVDDE